MPRIDVSILDSVFYLYETDYDANEGIQTGGTGFFVGVQSERFPERSDVYAITCKHIVKPNDHTGFTSAPVIRLNTKSGEFDIIPLETSDWYSFQDIFPNELHDIAVHELGDLDISHKINFVVRPQWFGAVDQLIETGPGDDVFMVGRYFDHDGYQKNRPSVRFGNISIMPHHQEKLPHWEGYGEISYIVEMRSVSGYSGSPVYLYEHGFRSIVDEDSGKPMLKPEAVIRSLLGIQWSQPPREEYHEELNRYVKVFAGMNNVIPAIYIYLLLDWEVFKMHRQANDEKYAREQKKRPPQIPTGGNREKKPFTEEDFEEVLRKVSRQDTPEEKARKKKKKAG